MRLVAITFLLLCISEASPASESPAPEIRRPIAAARSDDGAALFVANQTGEVVTVNVTNRAVMHTSRVARSLSDLVALPNSAHLLALDDVNHALLVLSVNQSDGAIRVAHRVRTPEFPIRAAVSADGDLCVVASRWSQSLSIVDLTSGTPAILQTVPLSFPPQELLLLPEDRFLIADAFAGELAVIDRDGSITAQHSLHGHNIRGMVFDADGESILVTHQILSRIAQADFSDIFWGVLMKNVLRRVPLAALLDPESDLETDGRIFELGDLRNGAADPGGIARTKTGYVLAISGRDQIAFEQEDALFEGNDRVRVGARPTRVITSEQDDLVFVVNALSDSIAVLSSEEREAEFIGDQNEPSTSPLTAAGLSAIERGERAFYSGSLSNDGWMSCNSCHVDGHTPDLLADTLGDGTYGTPKKIPSLFGTIHSGPWAWDGSMKSIEEQVAKSLKSTMHGQSTHETAAIDITAYLTSLSVPQLTVESSELSRRGEQIFDRLNCSHCHDPDPGQTAVFDVGFTDEEWKRYFNAPALDGVRFRRAFLHDGRATSLKELFTTHAHPPGISELTADDVEALIAYVRSR